MSEGGPMKICDSRAHAFNFHKFITPKTKSNLTKPNTDSHFGTQSPKFTRFFVNFTFKSIIYGTFND